MWQLQWSIDVYVGASLAELAPAHTGARPALMAADVTDLPARAIADPFLIIIEGRWYLFCEVWNAATGRGEIAYATSSDAGLTWTYRESVLREPFHLSYPHVFAANGQVFMIPESRRDHGIYLYVAEDFPKGWRRIATLATGPFADATVTRHDDRWWLFAQRGLDELCLFSSRELEGPWQPHPASPLWPGNRSRTRPGGRMLIDAGQLVRFAQDGWPTYGHSLRAFDVLALTESRYQERERPSSPILRASRSGWNAVGMHHIDAVQRADGSWLAVVDGASPTRHQPETSGS